MLEYGAESSFDPRNAFTPTTSAWKLYSRLVGYALQHKGKLAVSIFFAIVVAASFSTTILTVGAAVKVVFSDADEVDRQVDGIASAIEDALPFAPDDLETRLGSLVDSMRDDRVRAAAALAVILVALVLIGGIARYLQEYYAGIIGADISVQLAGEMYQNMMGLSLSFFEKRGQGEILARFTNDIFMINRGLIGALVRLIREPVKVVFFLGIALYIHVWMTLLVLIVFPLAGYAIVRIGKKIRKYVRRSLENIGSMVTVAAETLTGILIIQGFNMQHYKTSHVIAELGKLRRQLVKTARANAAVGPVTEALLVLGLVVFMIAAAQSVENGTLDGGDLIMLFGTFAALMDPVRKLSSVNNMIQTSVASAERIFEYMDMRPDIVEKPDAKELAPMKESIVYENVSFSYDGKMEVLKDVNLEIKMGEMVALVGFSGAGKTTMVKLLPRFYDVTAGRITIDGIDIRDATLRSLRDQMGIVTQETVLFHESVRENIAAGDANMAEERIADAARAAHADEFIKAKLANGFDTVIGDGGAGLSGGQKQRIAIARAIAKDPPILILDEATSSLDSESERAIQDAMKEFVQGRTTLVIAHRLSTIQQADRIVVFDDGQIVEMGTHSELLRNGGIYRRLYETQFRSADDTDVA